MIKDNLFRQKENCLKTDKILFYFHLKKSLLIMTFNLIIKETLKKVDI